jgi:hypothetical protein
MRRREPVEFVTSEDHPLVGDVISPISDEEAEKCNYVVAKRSDELDGKPLAEGCTLTPCVACGAEVVVDPRDPVSPPRVCVPCLMGGLMEESN